MLNVVMPSGTLAEIQINTPEMLAAKEAQGHALYEALRAEPKGSERAKALHAASVAFYAAARAADKKSDSEIFNQRVGHDFAGVIPSQGDLSLSENILPSGNSTNMSSTPSPSSKSMPKVQPGGNDSGTFISNTSTSIVGDATRSDADVVQEENRGGKQGQV